MIDKKPYRSIKFRRDEKFIKELKRLNYTFCKGCQDKNFFIIANGDAKLVGGTNDQELFDLHPNPEYIYNGK